MIYPVTNFYYLLMNTSAVDDIKNDWKRLAMNGFDKDEIIELKNLGFNDTEINQIQGLFLSLNFSRISREIVSNVKKLTRYKYKIYRGLVIFLVSEVILLIVSSIL